jgi:hypothetical protein
MQIQFPDHTRAEAQYKTQVQLYALALQRATGLPARAILLEV